MKYIRRIVGSVIAVIFLASVIIGIGVIFAVRNVNVTLQSYKYSDWDSLSEESKAAADEEIKAVKSAVLGKYKGKIIGFVNEDGVEACVGDSGFILESLEKQMPCTLNITVIERRETFKVASGDGLFDIYDDFGKLMRSGVSAENSNNAVDGAPTVELVRTGEADAAWDIEKISGVARSFAQNFGPVRSTIERIEFTPATGYVGDFTDIRLRCGLTVRIADSFVLTDNKTEAACRGFSKLTDEQKLGGTVSVLSANGKISAMYYPEDGSDILQLV